MRVELRPGGRRRRRRLARHLPRPRTGGARGRAALGRPRPPRPRTAGGATRRGRGHRRRTGRGARRARRHPRGARRGRPHPGAHAGDGRGPRHQPTGEDRETMATLASALATRQLLGGPWVPTDLTAILDGGPGGGVGGPAQPRPPGVAHPVPRRRTGHVDPRRRRAAHRRGARRSCRPAAGDPPGRARDVSSNRSGATGRSRSAFVLDGAADPIDAVGVDTALAAHFARRRPGARGAHACWPTSPSSTTTTRRSPVAGVAVVPPRTWAPDGAFVDALLGGLETSPVLRGVEPRPVLRRRRRRHDRDRVAVRRRSSGSGRRTRRRRRPAATFPSASITAARRRIERFASAIDATDPGGAAILDRLDRTLLATTSVDLRPRDRRRLRHGCERPGQRPDRRDRHAARTVRSR